MNQKTHVQHIENTVASLILLIYAKCNALAFMQKGSGHSFDSRSTELLRANSKNPPQIESAIETRLRGRSNHDCLAGTHTKSTIGMLQISHRQYIVREFGRQADRQIDNICTHITCTTPEQTESSRRPFHAYQRRNKFVPIRSSSSFCFSCVHVHNGTWHSLVLYTVNGSISKQASLSSTKKKNTKKAIGKIDGGPHALTEHRANPCETVVFYVLTERRYFYVIQITTEN